MQASEKIPGSDVRLCHDCGQPWPVFLFDEAGQAVETLAEATHIIPRQYCTCAEGQARKVEEERRQKQEAWLREARQKTVCFDNDQYAQFQLRNFDPSRNQGRAGQALAMVEQYIDHVINDRTKRWLFLTGPNGTGKTHLAVAAARKIAAYRLWSAYVAVWPQHCSLVKESWDQSSGAGPNEAQLWGAMRAAKLLLIDDIDKGSPSQWATEKLYEVIDHRKTKGRLTIITANHTLAQLRGLWRTSKIEYIRDAGSAIIDRIAEMLYQEVQFEGESQRWNQA